MGADSYWARRSTEREEEWNKKSQETVEKELAAQYERSAQRIQANIEQLYGKFANDNGISISEAKKLINGPEFRTWKKDVEEYMKEYKETGNPKTLLELNTLSMRSRISRLDKLYGNTLIEIDKLGQKTNASITGFLKSAYKDNRLHSAYELAKRGQGPLGVAVDNKHVESVLRTPWSGKNYSTRIWDNSDKLSKTIQEVVVSNVHRGTSVEKLAKEVQERMNVSKNDAVRLVRTELNYVHNQATLDSLKSANMEYFQFIATIDKRTSSTCREHDNNIYPVADAEVGTNVPPLHPRCRSTIAGTIDKKATSGSRTVKMAKANKNEPTRYEKVPRNMDYDNWKAIYVDKSKMFAEWRSEQKAVKAIKSVAHIPEKTVTTDMIRDKLAKIDLPNATPQDIISVGKMVVKKHNIVDIIGNTGELKSVLSEYRDMGSIVPKTMWAKGANAVNKKLLQDAFELYPSDWLQYVKDSNRKICSRKVVRGYFSPMAKLASGKIDWHQEGNPKTDYISINMDGIRRTTPFHEIGHMVEYFNKDALRLSIEFRNMRTRGEKVQLLADLLNIPAYKMESTYADNFINPYIGKDYGNDASEVLSMGLESIFVPSEIGHIKRYDYKNNQFVYATITDDMEYLYFIIGMILTV
jgi:SPP1 gp7 family putative phage head morphogenesis protein